MGHVSPARPVTAARLVASAVLLLTTVPAWPHAIGTSGPALLDWHNEHIARVVSASYSWNNLGVTVINAAGGVVTVDGKRCLRGTQFDLDVADEYAFDLDETVTVELEVHQPSGGPLLLAYDKSDGTGHEIVTLPDRRGQGSHVVRLSLLRAQLANRGDYGTDLMIAGQAAMVSFDAGSPPLTICDVSVERSYTTPAPAAHGWLDLTVAGENGAPMPARVGLYDATGRMPIPSNDAIEIKKFDDRTRTYLLRAPTVWPADNKFVFYVDGKYRTRLPAGSYRLIASRGIEYRLIDERITLKAGETLAKTVRLVAVGRPTGGGLVLGRRPHPLAAPRRDRRALDAAAGAGGGPQRRQPARDGERRDHALPAAWVGAAGGALGRAWCTPWSPVRRIRAPATAATPSTSTSLPRCAFPTSTSCTTRSSRRSPSREVYRAMPTSWGMSWARCKVWRSTASSTSSTSSRSRKAAVITRNWFDLLNLGLRIAPAAGTDYPYLDHPGAVRNYVHIPGGWSVDGWFAGLGAGHTFVTTGALVALSINGKGMGEELRVAAGDRSRSRRKRP